MTTRTVSGYLPNLLGPVVISWDGTSQTARPTLNFKGGVLTDDDANDRLDLDFGSHSSGALKIYNPLGTFYYTIAGSAIVANRTLTLPLLTAGDTVVCEAFAQTLTNKTLTSPIINGQTQGAAVAVSALAIDWSAGAVFTKTLAAGGNTFTFSNAASGQVIVVRLTSDGGGSTVTWPTVLWAGGVAPTQTSTGVDVYTFVHDGTNIYGSVVQAMA
jgi:hypothetical protein